MAEALLQGLSITGLGMGLVFLMIIVLWGIMALLVRLTNRPEKEAETDDLESPASAEPRTYAAQAAAAAIRQLSADSKKGLYAPFYPNTAYSRSFTFDALPTRSLR